MSSNLHFSPVFDMLNTTIAFGIYNEVFQMVPLYYHFSKQYRQDLIWRRAWALEDVYWGVQGRCNKILDIDNTVSVLPEICWWQISDWYPGLMRICEVMA